MATHSIFQRPGDLNSGPHACSVSALPQISYPPYLLTRNFKRTCTLASGGGCEKIVIYPGLVGEGCALVKPRHSKNQGTGFIGIYMVTVTPNLELALILPVAPSWLELRLKSNSNKFSKSSPFIRDSGFHWARSKQVSNPGNLQRRDVSLR